MNTKQVDGKNQASQPILLAVTGMSPAVLTETVWALSRENPAVIPARVITITTSRGKELLEQELFHGLKASDRLWSSLRKAILGRGWENDPRLNFESPRLITVPNIRTGRSDGLDDFRTSADNVAAADFLLEQVRGLAETPDTQLIASIAGGRKTLGALLYACMSLLGRETDRLTHVLVNNPYDRPDLKPRFYFNEQPEQKLVLDGKSPIRARDAQVSLADIPFVPLRNLFDRDIIKRPCSFTELVRRCKKKVDEAVGSSVQLKIWRSRKQIDVNGIKVQTSSAQHVLLLFLAEPGMTAARAQISKFDNAIPSLKLFSREIHEKRKRDDFSDWRHEALLPNAFNDQNIRKLLNELKAKLRKAGDGASALVPLLPRKGRFLLDLQPTAITVCD